MLYINRSIWPALKACGCKPSDLRLTFMRQHRAGERWESVGEQIAPSTIKTKIVSIVSDKTKARDVPRCILAATHARFCARYMEKNALKIMFITGALKMQEWKMHER